MSIPATPSAPGDFLTFADIARELDMSHSSLKRLHADRQAPPFAKIGGRLMIKRSLFETWRLAKQRGALEAWARAISVQSDIRAGRL